MERFKQWFTRRKIFSDLSEEIRQHLAEKADALMANGMSRQEAETAALREFGNVTATAERGRDIWRWPIIDALLGDIKFALRQLRKNLGFAFTAILTLALGIGTTTAIFSLVNAVVLRPLPFPQQDSLMWLKQQDHSLPGVIPDSLSYPDYFDWRAQNQTFTGIASYRSGTAILESGDEPRHLDAMIVSANLFAVLGVAPVIGRDFRPDDEKPGNRAVMLSYALWQSAFGRQKISPRRRSNLAIANMPSLVLCRGVFDFPWEIRRRLYGCRWQTTRTEKILQPANAVSNAWTRSDG